MLFFIKSTLAYIQDKTNIPTKKGRERERERENAIEYKKSQREKYLLWYLMRLGADGDEVGSTWRKWWDQNRNRPRKNNKNIKKKQKNVIFHFFFSFVLQE